MLVSGRVFYTNRNGWQWIWSSSGSVLLFERKITRHAWIWSPREFKPRHYESLPVLKPMGCDEHQTITMFIVHSLERDPTLHLAAWNWVCNTVIRHWPQPKRTFFLKRSTFQLRPPCRLVTILCFSIYTLSIFNITYIRNKYIYNV